MKIGHDAEIRLWNEIEQAVKMFTDDRYRLGKLCFQLQNLYSERGNSGGGRRASGHGEFERQLLARGFKPRRVREWINDFLVSEGLLPATESTRAKRKARRSKSEEYQRGYRAAIRSTHASLEVDPLTRFAVLLPFCALEAAKRAGLQSLQGSVERTKELIAAWEEVKRLRESADAAEPELRVQ